MDTLTELLAYTLALVLVLMALGWFRSLQVGKVDIVDSFWGAGFLAITWWGAFLGQGAIARSILVTTLVTIWAARLIGHVTIRNWDKPEDKRYANFRRGWGMQYPGVSLVTVFLLQGALCWVISLPLQVALWSPMPEGLALSDVLGALLFVVGLYFEAVGDWQLQQFKKDPRNVGKVLDQGLWGRTRHPNYFGECCIWWGFWLIAASTPYALVTLISPVVITFLLLKVSGVRMTEKVMADRSQYAAYVQRTPAFFPKWW